MPCFVCIVVEHDRVVIAAAAHLAMDDGEHNQEEECGDGSNCSSMAAVKEQDDISRGQTVQASGIGDCSLMTVSKLQ